MNHLINREEYYKKYSLSRLFAGRKIIHIGPAMLWKSTFQFEHHCHSNLNISTKLKALLLQSLISVGMTGFEPATPSSRTKYATGLRYIPK